MQAHPGSAVRLELALLSSYGDGEGMRDRARARYISAEEVIYDQG